MPRKVAFLLSPDFSNLGLALAVETLFIGNWLAQQQVFDWSILSADGQPVRASNNMLVPVDGSLPEGGAAVEKTFQTIFVLASFNPKQHAKDQRVTNWLRRMARFGVEIGGIETGSEILAAAGLLDDHEVAAHWDNLEGFQERYPNTKAKPILYKIDRGRLTCAGATAILDMMLHWMGLHGEGDLAEEIGQHMLIGRQRAGAQEQCSSEAQGDLRGDGGKAENGGQAIRRAVEIMREAIEEPLSCGEIAAMVGLSQRQLQRHFQHHLGTTLTREYTRIRLAKAHQLLQQTELPVTEVAMGCGFTSLENFSRVYRSVFGCSPSADRRQTTTAPVFRRKGVTTLAAKSQPSLQSPTLR
jgi:AraC family carnitine catabolism transcriptional activator